MRLFASNSSRKVNRTDRDLDQGRSWLLVCEIGTQRVHRIFHVKSDRDLIFMEMLWKKS